MEMQVEGLSALRKALKDKANTLDKDLQEVVLKNTKRLERSMKEHAHFTKGYSTGNLRRSINMEISPDGLTGTVSPNTEYDVYVEYGTSKMEAQPYVRPAFDEVSKEFMNDIDNLLN